MTSVQQIGRFGQVVKFFENRSIYFPVHFYIKFTGKRQVASPTFKPGFTYWDFEITNLDISARKVISWSSGTGDIGPTLFEVDGKKFNLELKFSDKLGKLAENELVINQE